VRLGFTSFGGPVAHIGYFREAYVVRRRWLDEREFAELVAIANLLPGPSSSQLGIAIGARRAGRLGGLVAWLGFTLPSAVVMTVLAFAVASADVADAGWVHGLELVAVPVVASAVGVNREIVQDGVNGFLASTPGEWRQKLSALMGDGELRRRMGAAGRRTIQARYSLQVNGPRVAAVIGAALARTRASDAFVHASGEPR